MRVHIRNILNDLHAPLNSGIAFDGFQKMGAEIVLYDEVTQINNHSPEEVLVGYIGDVKQALRQLNKAVPDEINYPEELTDFLGRKVWESTINTVANNQKTWNIFVKPKFASKKFTGKVIRSTADLVGCGDPLEDTPVLCSEIANFEAEWRCFVRYGEILDVRMYKGDWRKHFDYCVIEAAIKAYKTAPAGYGIDFGLTEKGETLLIEVNDGYSLGSYGLFPILYAKLLAARWAEMTGTSDEFNF